MVKSFVIDFNDVMIVPTVINLAHILGLRVVAEGIKNKEVWDKLVALECNIAQGYILSATAPV